MINYKGITKTNHKTSYLKTSKKKKKNNRKNLVGGTQEKLGTSEENQAIINSMGLLNQINKKGIYENMSSMTKSLGDNLSYLKESLTSLNNSHLTKGGKRKKKRKKSNKVKKFKKFINKYGGNQLDQSESESDVQPKSESDVKQESESDVKPKFESDIKQESKSVVKQESESGVEPKKKQCSLIERYFFNCKNDEEKQLESCLKKCRANYKITKGGMYRKKKKSKKTKKI